jgi:hypothetical protein
MQVLSSAKEAKIAIIKVEGITKRVIVEVEILPTVLVLQHLSLEISSYPPKQAPQLSFPMHKHHSWLKPTAAHYNFLVHF